MLTITDYSKLQAGIFNGTNRVNRLQALLQALGEFQDLIFSPDVRNDVDYDANELIEEMQAPLENLTCTVEKLISAEKKTVNFCNEELIFRLFSDEYCNIETRGDLTDDWSYLDKE